MFLGCYSGMKPASLYLCALWNKGIEVHEARPKSLKRDLLRSEQFPMHVRYAPRETCARSGRAVGVYCWAI